MSALENLVNNAFAEMNYPEAKAELALLKNRVIKLELALRVASACNYGASIMGQAIWNPASPFQMRINELVGEPPYDKEGDK